MGRIAFVAFMTERDCREILRKLNGICFSKGTEALRNSGYWQEYDDFTRYASGYLPTAEAKAGQWCPVASKLIDGKLDPNAGRPSKS